MKKAYLSILVLFLVLVFVKSQSVFAEGEGTTLECNNPENAIIYMSDIEGKKILNMRCQYSGDNSTNLYYKINNATDAAIAQSFIAIGTAAKYAKKPFSISHINKIITRVF